MNMLIKEYRYFASLALMLIALGLYFCGMIPFLNMCLLPALAISILFAEVLILTPVLSKKLAAIFLYLVSIALGFFIALYRSEGFIYPLAWHADQLYPGGEPFSHYINLSKALGAYLLFIYLFKPGGCMSLGKSLFVVFSFAAILLALAHFFFDIAWQFKFIDSVWLFILFNGAVTVVSEEVFFRLFIQQKLQQLFANKLIWQLAALVVSASIFSLAHGIQMFLLFFIAGLVYGGVYMITKRISMAIAVHLLVNVMHFIFLEYPL